jgi:hypothetical protein
VGALLVLRRDWQRRNAGLTRRSAREVVASALAQTSISPLRWLALFIIRHRLSTYALTLFAVFLLVKYQQLLRRVTVRVASDYPPPAALAQAAARGSAAA